MNNFIYNEESRIHTLNERIIPSVSQAIAPLNDFSGIPEKKLARKAELGRQFHEAIRLHLLNDLFFDSIDPALVKPMNAFIEWWPSQNIGGADLKMEMPLCHPRLKYCGKPDLYTESRLFDWKLRPYKPVTDILQLEGYRRMLPPGKRERWVISVTLEGKLTRHRAENTQAWGIFRKMLERWYSDNEFNELVRAWEGMN